MATQLTQRQLNPDMGVAGNLLKNGNFINNSTSGYGSTPDDWTSSSANPVQGGFPSMTKQQLIDLLGVSDGDIEGLWNLNEASGNATDLSANGYTLTDTNTVGASDDGLMGKARDFELDNSEYLIKTTPTNLLIAGSQTWFAFVKPEAVSASAEIMAHSDSGVTVYGLLRNQAGLATFQLSGLSTVTVIASDVKMEAGKWYFVCGVYDAANTKLKIWVNGIKKETTASGNHTITGTQGFTIGNLGLSNQNYYDGLIQNAGVLSVALTDSQVKKLFAATLYRGQKIRRATTDAALTQTLGEDLVERLRGKKVTMVAKMYQDTASAGQISINDGAEVLSATSATTGSWLSVYVTDTISATATSITLSLKHSTGDGNTWFKEVAIYEGSSPVYTWYPSYDDIARFPRLLKMDFPAMFNGYSFEENKWFTWIPTLVGYSGTPTVNSARYMYSGKIGRVALSFTGTSNNAGLTATAPFKGGASSYYNVSTAIMTDNSSVLAAAGRMHIDQNGTLISFGKTCAADDGFTNSGTKAVLSGVYQCEID